MKNLLHVGLSGLDYFPEKKVHHHPIIQLIDVGLSSEILEELPFFDNIVITSKSTVEFFLKKYKKFIDPSVKIFSIGPQTSSSIEKEGFRVYKQAERFTQEGLIEVFRHLNLSSDRILFPRSDLARNTIDSYFKKLDLNYLSCICYQTIPNSNFPALKLENYDEIFFTSPSTVKYFFDKYPQIPCGLNIIVIGEITYDYLINYRVVLNNIEIIKT